jgi:hypothetical protein
MSDTPNSPSTPENVDLVPIEESMRQSIVAPVPQGEQFAGDQLDTVESDEEDVSGEEEETSEGTADTGDWAVPVGLFSPKTLCSW